MVPRRAAILLALLAHAGAATQPAASCPAGTDGDCLASPGDDDVAGLIQVRRHQAEVEQQTLEATHRKAGHTDRFRQTKPTVFAETSVERQQQSMIEINEDGEVNTYYLPGATVLDGRTVEYNSSYMRFYLMKRYTTNYSNPEDYYYLPLIGKTFSVDISFGPEPAACGCNVNVYFVQMPYSTPGPGGDYYCDAQCPEDSYGCCEEYDMFEASGVVSQQTNHACNPPYPDNPTWQCDPWGSPENKTEGTDMGISGEYDIDTTKNYTFSQRFDEDAQGRLVITTTINQTGSVGWVRRMGPDSELDSIMPNLTKGLALVTGYWAGGMQWMDGDANGQCDYSNGPLTCNGNTIYIGNWSLTTNTGPIPPTTTSTTTPAPTLDSVCMYPGAGSTCADLTEEDWSNWEYNDYCDAAEANCEDDCGGDWCATPKTTTPSPTARRPGRPFRPGHGAHARGWRPFVR